jgi:hypothetical protein
MSTVNRPAVRARRPAVVAAALGVAFLVVYGIVLANQDDVGVAWFYVLLVLAAIAGCVVTAVSGRPVTAGLAAVIFGVCMLLGLLSIGILLLPATVLAVLAFAFARGDRAAAARSAPRDTSRPTDR